MEQTQSTTHQLHHGDSRNMSSLSDQSVDLVVTSPPYPMISMWDDVFHQMNHAISPKTMESDPNKTFELMHRELDKVWREVDRVLKPAGLVCINVGDATRTIDGRFRLYPNHSRIITYFLDKGYSNLPNIIWKKPTNAPNKFMGSGTLPVGAYVTLEHEYILIFRKGDKRGFNSLDERKMRQQSAFFWEERNLWFSDNWELKGKTQRMNGPERARSGAYPFEIAHRLINMFSLIGDTVLDPFNGTGTTTEAAIVNGRNSISYELDEKLNQRIKKQIPNRVSELKAVTAQRLDQHRAFIKQSENLRHHNRHYDLPVKTRQETELKLPVLLSIQAEDDQLCATYE